MPKTNRPAAPHASADGTRRREKRSITLSLAAAATLLALAGCATGGTDVASGAPGTSELNRVAREAISSSGNVQVQLLDGTAYVSGNLESATDQRAIERALLDVDGVERVRMSVRREM